MTCLTRGFLICNVVLSPDPRDLERLQRDSVTAAAALASLRQGLGADDLGTGAQVREHAGEGRVASLSLQASAEETQRQSLVSVAPASRPPGAIALL